MRKNALTSAESLYNHDIKIEIMKEKEWQIRPYKNVHFLYINPSLKKKKKQKPTIKSRQKTKEISATWMTEGIISLME